MKKLFVIICIVILFFGIVGCPSEDSASNAITPIDGGPSPGTPASPVPEPATLILLGSGLVGLAGFGRKIFKK